jgi:amino acid adenylation domain-containing protein
MHIQAVTRLPSEAFSLGAQESAGDDPIDWPFARFLPFARDASVVDHFEEVAGRFANRLAVADGVRTLTYGALACLAGGVEAATVAATARRDGPVAILLGNEARYPGALLGALASGRAVVPLDADHPIARNREIAIHAGAVAVVSVGDLAAEARALFPPQIPVLDIAAADANRPAAMTTRPKPDDPAYIVYTSGSTGAPKGVVQNHRGLLQDLAQSINFLHLSPEDRLALFYSPSLISGLRIALGGLLSGASLHVIQPRNLSPRALLDAVRVAAVTVFRSGPSIFRHAVSALAKDQRLTSVRLVLLGGDRVDWSDVDLFRRCCPPAAVIGVHLGSTESSLHSEWFVDERLRPEGGLLPVGRAISGRRVTIADETGRPLADGEIGEFVVSSRFLALGYWRAPELSRAAFATDPDDPEARTYRTGDMGLRRADGLFEFVGRKDEQIKLRGYRIEPGEIESGLRACAGVADAAVVVRRSADGAPRALVAYVQLQPGVVGLLPRHLTLMAKRRLPPFMIPSAFFLVDELPRLPSLKIDRTRLAALDAQGALQPPDEGKDPMLDAIAGLFESVLSTTGATADDTLATLGGDSMKAVEIALELERRFGLAVETLELLTIRELARLVAAGERRAPAKG